MIVLNLKPMRYDIETPAGFIAFNSRRARDAAVRDWIGDRVSYYIDPASTRRMVHYGVYPVTADELKMVTECKTWRCRVVSQMTALALRKT